MRKFKDIQIEKEAKRKNADIKSILLFNLLTSYEDFSKIFVKLHFIYCFPYFVYNNKIEKRLRLTTFISFDFLYNNPSGRFNDGINFFFTTVHYFSIQV